MVLVVELVVDVELVVEVDDVVEVDGLISVAIMLTEDDNTTAAKETNITIDNSTCKPLVPNPTTSLYQLILSFLAVCLSFYFLVAHPSLASCTLVISGNIEQ